MSTTRTFFASNVLPNGNVFLVGGEYTSPDNETWTNTGEIYNPVNNSWSPIPSVPTPAGQFGDDPTEVLSNGNILAGYLYGPQTYIYDPSTNTWSPWPTKLYNDRSDEETWVKLPNGNILSYDVNQSLTNAQMYVPSTNQWVAAGTLTEPLTSSTVGSELGPALLLPDGRVFQLGANGNTAFYTPSTNSWTTGPSIPESPSGQQLVAADVPGAMLPNGDVLFAASQNYESKDTRIFEFNPITNVYTDVTPPDSTLNSNYNFQTRMLVLPTGQVLFSDGSNQLWVYTPSGSPNSSWQPTITSVTNTGSGTFTLGGTRLNGISEGASYGDDAEMSSNYPIVQWTASNGNVYYARTSNWSSTGVAAAGSGTAETVDFTLPTGLPQATYQLSVVANGIASAPINFDPANSFWTQVELNNYYNQVGISDGKTFSGGGLDGYGHELGTPGGIGWQSTLVPYGPPNANDVVSATGQTVTLPAGTYSTLTLFATAVNADQTNQPFTIVYANGATQTFKQSLTNWTSVPGQYSDEMRAQGLYQYNANGTNTGQTVYDSAYVLPLNTTESIASIILPDDPDVVILGMLLA